MSDSRTTSTAAARLARASRHPLARALADAAGPGLRWVVNTPEWHHWHHSVDPEDGKENMVGTATLTVNVLASALPDCPSTASAMGRLAPGSTVRGAAGTPLAQARLRDQPRQVLVPQRQPRLVLVQRRAQRGRDLWSGERLQVADRRVLELRAGAERAHRAVGVLARPVRGTHDQPLDAGECNDLQRSGPLRWLAGKSRLVAVGR